MEKTSKKSIVNPETTNVGKRTLLYCVCLFLTVVETGGQHSTTGQTQPPTEVNFSPQAQHITLQEDSVTTNYASTVTKTKHSMAEQLSDVTTEKNGGSSHDVTSNPDDAKQSNGIAKDTAQPGQLNEETAMTSKTTDVANPDHEEAGLLHTEVNTTTQKSATKSVIATSTISNPTSQDKDVPHSSLNVDCATDISAPPTADGEYVIKMTKPFHNNSAINMFNCSSRMFVPIGSSVDVYFDNVSKEPSYECEIRVTFCNWETECTVILLGHSALRSYHRLRERKTKISLLAEECYSFHVEIHYTSVPDAVFETLRVVNTSPNSGYVISPGFDVNRFYPMNVAMMLTIEVAPDRVILLSFPHFHMENALDCRYDWLQLILVNTSGNHSVWKKCGRQDIPSQVFPHSILFRFISDKFVQKSGFQILYTILPRSQEPQIVSTEDGLSLFNCSVPHFSKFAHHFNCNLAIDCTEAEDEVHCPYSSPDCGPGYIEAGDKCYEYTRIRVNSSWSNARSYCHRLNRTLVSPSDPAQWKRFKEIMVRYGRKTSTAFTGLRTSENSVAMVPSLYRNMLQWTGGTMAIYANVSISYGSDTIPFCSYFQSETNQFSLVSVSCLKTFDSRFVCEKAKEASNGENVAPLSGGRSVVLPSLSSNYSWFDGVTHCPEGHVVLDFLSCDQQSRCQRKRHSQYCDTQGVSEFQCGFGTHSVHYTLTCDFRTDCPDGSDEDFCKHPKCQEDKCRSGQCLARNHRCDGLPHCNDGSDEKCPQRVRYVPMLPPPAVVNFNGKGKYSIQAMKDDDDPCPNTHFRCVSSNYCLPLYVRCNNVYDCPDHEDEAGCETFQCPGYFRCRRSTVCLHPQHLCDGAIQCPQHDDELLCDLHCPKGCFCQGLAFVCKQQISPSDFPSLRYLDASGSDMKMEAVAYNDYLIYLSLASCHIEDLLPLDLKNLRTLDLSHNLLTTLKLESLLLLGNLRSLYLVGNPLVTMVTVTSPRTTCNAFRYIDLSETLLETFNASIFSSFPEMRTLNFSKSKQLSSITEEGFKAFPGLEVVDLRSCPRLENYPADLLQGLHSLREVYADDYRLCCKAALPVTFDTGSCHAPADDIASCDDLLRSDTFRVFLWVFAVLAVLGNASSIFTRCYVQNESFQSSFNVFVTNLSVADFLMGVYLTVIGAADEVYKGHYLWQGDAWKNSVACQTAGFLSLLSTEVSAFFICLITLDRFLVLRFPFSKVHFSKKSALVVCGFAWFAGFVLAVVPLLPMTSHWMFYSQTGICIPLPFFSKEDRFLGHTYSFGVMIVLNLLLFLLIAVGQIFIYIAVKSGTQIKRKASRDVAIARRLTTIVLSDFICWFPIGLMGLLAYTGTPIPTDVNVGVAIFVLPFNSALNPFLYTFNTVMEKRRKAVEARMLQRLETRYVSEMPQLPSQLTVTKETALNQIEDWLGVRVITLSDLAARFDMAPRMHDVGPPRSDVS